MHSSTLQNHSLYFTYWFSFNSWMILLEVYPWRNIHGICCKVNRVLKFIHQYISFLLNIHLIDISACVMHNASSNKFEFCLYRYVSFHARCSDCYRKSNFFPGKTIDLSSHWPCLRKLTKVHKVHMHDTDPPNLSYLLEEQFLSKVLWCLLSTTCPCNQYRQGRGAVGMAQGYSWWLQGPCLLPAWI